MINTEHFGRYISVLYRQGNSYLSKKYERLGIGAGQYLFLIHLYKKDGISQDKLSELINIDKGTTAKAVKKLEENGLVTREKDHSDKRVNKIFLTKKALDIKTDFFEVISDWEKSLTKDLTEEEINLGLDILNKMYKNVLTEEE